MRREYKFKVNEIVETKIGKLQIIECIRFPHGKVTEKGYTYKCLSDGYFGKISEIHLKQGIGCPVCVGRVVIKDINSIFTTHPHLVKYFVNIEDTYNLTYCSNKRVLLKCPICGEQKYSNLNNFFKCGFSCPKCGDGISYPNKCIFNILNQLNVRFETEKVFKWAKDKRYDFYLYPDTIIEVHGIQHYVESSRGRLLKEEQKNDLEKEIIAKKNDIKNYIVIDARKSDLNWIITSVFQSKLNELFDLSKLDYNKIEEFCSNSLVMICSEVYNNETTNTTNIAEKLKICRPCVVKYLKIATSIGWCKYDPIKSLKHSVSQNGKLNTKKVVCLNNKQVFDSILKAQIFCNVPSQNIVKCCKHKRESAGKHPQTNEPYKWMYYEEWIKLNKKEVNDYGTTINVLE